MTLITLPICSDTPVPQAGDLACLLIGHLDSVYVSQHGLSSLVLVVIVEGIVDPLNLPLVMQTQPELARDSQCHVRVTADEVAAHLLQSLSIDTGELCQRTDCTGVATLVDVVVLPLAALAQHHQGVILLLFGHW